MHAIDPDTLPAAADFTEAADILADPEALAAWRAEHPDLTDAEIGLLVAMMLRAA